MLCGRSDNLAIPCALINTKLGETIYLRTICVSVGIVMMLYHLYIKDTDVTGYGKESQSPS